MLRRVMDMNYIRSWQLLTSPIRPLPDIIIIGGQKCGTTSLYHYLCQHPEIYPGNTKEVHYFDDNYERGSLWYRSHFPFRNRGRFAIEATPNYMFHRASHDRLCELLPNVKLIAVLREPVERAYSHYRHMRRGMGNRGREHRSFEEAIRLEMELVSKGVVFGGDSYRDRYFTYVRRGLYAFQLERYLKSHGQNLHVLSSSDLFRTPRSTLTKIFAFLEVEKYEVDTRTVYNQGNYRGIPFSMRDQLEAFFQPYNELLYDQLNVEAWWSYNTSVRCR